MAEFAAYRLRRLRRHDHSPRLELMPLMDVVFLLLTFFIYSFTMMIRADTVAVGLSPVAGGGPGDASGAIRLLTIDAAGGLSYDGRAVPIGELDALLAEVAGEAASATLYVSLAAEGTADRGPIVWELMQRLERAGLENLVFVGSPLREE